MAFLENAWDIRLEVGWDNLGEDLNFSSMGFLLRFKSSTPPTLYNTHYFNIILFYVFFWGRTNSYKHLYLNKWILNWHPLICHFFVKKYFSWENDLNFRIFSCWRHTCFYRKKYSEIETRISNGPTISLNCDAVFLPWMNSWPSFHC